MLIKIISLSFDSIFGGFNDDEIRDFLKDKELLSTQEHFFIKNDIPYLVFILKYLPHRAEAELKPGAPEKDKKDESWKKLLSEHDMGLFNILREWRAQRSKKDGLPPYILFTNQQLAMIVKKRPQSIAELTKIDGIGKGKSQKYGDEILEISKVKIESTESIKVETTEGDSNGNAT